MSSRARRLSEEVRHLLAGWESMGQSLEKIRAGRQARRLPVNSEAGSPPPVEQDLHLDLPAPFEPASPIEVVSPVPAREEVQLPAPANLDLQHAVHERVQALKEVTTPADKLDIDEELLPDLLAEYDGLHEGISQALEQWQAGHLEVVPELRRQVHTMKGLLRMAHAMRLGDQLHALESHMEDLEAGRSGQFTPDQVAQRYAAIHIGWQALLRPNPPATAASPTPGHEVQVAPILRVPSQVTVASELVDRLITETNESRLTSTYLEGNAREQREILRDLVKNTQSLGRLLRDLEVYAESQIQSRRAQLAPGEDFDPLEMDRYTLLQELSRSLIEAGSDAVDLQRDLNQRLGEQEHLLTYQGRILGEVQEGLHKTRLTPVSELYNRLNKVIENTAREVGKQVTFVLDSGNLDLDRVLLTRVVAPLEHILRNAVDHGLEKPEVRASLDKSEDGKLTIRVRQEAGRVYFEVSDDGAGLNVERIQAKAVEKRLWPADRAMRMEDAADMICQPGFSTAAALSQISGRGVGMDVVRAEVLGMGGRFRIQSEAGKGMAVTLELPTVVATASVLIVAGGGERWAIPVDLIEDVARHPLAALEEAAARGQWDSDVGFARLADLMGLPQAPVKGRSGLVLWLRENTRRFMVQVDAIGEVTEVPLRPAGTIWSGMDGVVGVTVLPDGQAAFLIDPLRARAPSATSEHPVTRERQATVLVVDDSITVRKATVRFLEREGYVALTAKDGQEAMEMLRQEAMRPDVVLLDVEMPRMNGFECLKAIRQDSQLKHLPVIMITSRTAAKHRQRAQDLGIHGYLGKPFQEEELARLLQESVATS